MKTNFIGSIILIFVFVSSFAQLQRTPYQKYSSIANTPYTAIDLQAVQKDAIKGIIKKSAYFQIEQTQFPKDYTMNALYASLMPAFNAMGDNWYKEQAQKIGAMMNWDVLNASNPNDLLLGQIYLDIFFAEKDVQAYEKLNKKLSILLNQKDLSADAWSNAEALFTAAPLYAQLGKATNDNRYNTRLHQLYWNAVDTLYYSREKLFHYDSKQAIELRKTSNVKNVFWGLENGMVLGGLARLIGFLSETDAMRAKYIQLFQELTYSLVRYQMEDGLWRSSIDDPYWISSSELGGSAFILYAIAKGMNEGWIPKAYFLPVLVKGWSGLLSSVTIEGQLGHGFTVAQSSKQDRSYKSKLYGSGAFILAGSEILKLDIDQAFEDAATNKFKPYLVAKDGAWTWYNDERVIFHNGVFYAGYVKRLGASAFSSFSKQNWAMHQSKREKILSSWNWSDDHNNAAFIPQLDGNVLSVYAEHDKSKGFFQRTITMTDGLSSLSDEKYTEVVVTKKDLTYSNLYRLSEEKNRIYNFHRGNNFNPNFVCSDDDGKTWNEPVLMITAGTNNKRPYVKYVSNGKDRIDMLYTDGHPRKEKQNNVYHFYYTKGAFYTSAGKKIRTLDELKTKPINPEEGTLIFDGSTKNGRGWVYDLEYDENGQPFAAFISSPSGDIGTDMRYWTSTFNGKKWKNEEIAFAGSNLYKLEQHYAGGFAIFPGKSNEVVISADVYPQTGKPLPNRKYQLFKGIKQGKDWTWTQLTFDPVFDHLRPVIVRGEEHALFWFTGYYHSFIDYHTDVMMSFEF